ncbi:glycogen-binding domain-containing protein [Desulfospira joergensenii]|uniref:glycogen-binding domain-containing protein n=1 Tax=Desulfospira joergensenii TaxID=53329 RepID=UPI0003B3C6E7|nr:glycogen-binding domain-containing protein [Desulfospira joergensenii]
MDCLPSMFLDDELDLEDKKRFVEKIRSEPEFYALTLELLAQDQLLQEQPNLPESVLDNKWRSPAWIRRIRLLKPLGFAVSGFAAALLVFFFSFQPPACPRSSNRFVLYEPSAREVELAGSFTGWKRVPLKRIGTSGYWEINLPVAYGEHRFAYILDNDRQIADPTLPGREKDDFGGVNSILSLEKPI